MLDAEKVCSLTNDAEVNYLADLFLACLGLDKASRPYRMLRNAVIIATHCTDGMSEVYSALSLISDEPPTRVAAVVRKIFIDGGEALREKFNRSYGNVQDGEIALTLPSFANPDDTVMFLSTVFAYLIAVNYSKHTAEPII
ncbi:MAG: hypothetical protein J1G01_06890 [Clostridiales bacterium]|nr:hypothetical protein [Clostridiales bacterium]